MKYSIRSLKIIITVVILACLLSLPQMVFAGMNTAQTINCTFIKTTDNEAEAYVYATFLTPRNVVLNISLEEAPYGTTNYSIIEGPYSQIAYNTTIASDLVPFEYDDDCECRVKFEITDTLNGYETTVIRYAYLQDGED